MSDMNQIIRDRVRPPVETEPPSDEEQAWRDLDTDARRQGWHRGGFARRHQMRDDETYQRWTDGRAQYDPTYKPPTEGFGPPGPPTGRRQLTMNDRMRRALDRRSA